MRNIAILLILLVSNVSGFAFYGYGENIEDNKSNPFFITEANDFFSLNELKPRKYKYILFFCTKFC